MADPVRIGKLRWPVTLYKRQQTAQSGGVGVTETPLNETPLHADIQPIGAVQFYGALTADPDKPVTHRIITRWQDVADLTHAIQRVTSRADGTQRVEVFRVRRWYEIDGRKRFTCFECALESAQ